MRYAQIRKMDVSNGLGIGVSLFTQGCSNHCKGCFNPETWDFDGGEMVTEDTVKTIRELVKPNYITRFSVLGGEPLDERNLDDLFILIMSVRAERPDVSIWVYTGYTLEELMLRLDETTWAVLASIDVLVDGPFVQEKRDLTYPFAGSTNQRVIDMQKTLESKKIVLVDLE